MHSHQILISHQNELQKTLSKSILLHNLDHRKLSTQLQNSTPNRHKVMPKPLRGSSWAIRTHPSPPRQGWGRGGKGFWPRFGIPTGRPKSIKIRKSHTGIQHFTSLEHEQEKGRARDLSKEAKRSSRAGESSVLTFPPDTKKASKRPPKTSVFDSGGATKSLFHTLFGTPISGLFSGTSSGPVRRPWGSGDCH